MEVNGRVSNLIETLLVSLEYHVVATAVDHLVHVDTLVGILFGSIKVPVGEGMMSIKGLINNEVLMPLLGDATVASCVYALLFVCLNWSIGYILYKKKIYIKI